uniref:Uncharacterized protein n=1 Tax=Setaria digitata TaxID=48799 RepID=A0A915Q859_9BILA
MSRGERGVNRGEREMSRGERGVNRGKRDVDISIFGRKKKKKGKEEK